MPAESSDKKADERNGVEAGPAPSLSEAIAENKRLGEQVKQLVRTEARLHRTQNDLDHQLQVFGKLHELGLKINGTFVLNEIASHVVNFILYELGYEKSVLLLDLTKTGFLTVYLHDGFYDDGSAERLGSILIDATTHPLAKNIFEQKKVVYSPQLPNPDYDEFAQTIGAGEFIGYPLTGENNKLLGFLVAANSPHKRVDNQIGGDAGLYISVTNLHSASGLANLSAQATAAINGALSHRALAEEKNLLDVRVKERTQELARALSDLEELDNAKSQFFANVSHELRTPLTLSIAPIEEIINRAATIKAEDRDRYLKVVYRNQLRLLKLINNLLDFAKIDAGKMTGSFQETEVSQALKFYVGTLESAADSRNIALTLDLPPGETKLFLDRDKFEKIVMNLLSNAFKFTPDGGRITIKLRIESDRAILDIADSGVGIPAEGIPKLFTRFMQVDSSAKRRYEGTGIGLAMVKEYVNLHGGDVGVDSEFGKGTTFHVIIPTGSSHLPADSIIAGASEEQSDISAATLADIRSESDDDDVVDEATDDAQVPNTDGAWLGDSADRPVVPVAEMRTEGATVLVVDDVPDMRRFVAGLLKDKYKVRTARDGLEALQIARLIHPDLIVSDVMMPRMTGYELCAAIKKDLGPLSRTPIILLSAKGELGPKLEGLEHGADDYLVKPFNADELLTRARNSIRLRLQEKALSQTRVDLLEAERRALQSDLRAEQERRRGMARFFSGPVIEQIVQSENPKDLEPRVCESTVMFFDIRGFSSRSEGRNDKILGLLSELRTVMTAMTAEIFAENGVVLHYVGDGIIACWNVPFPDPHHVDRACRAALRMVDALARLPGGWQCGIGLHTGELVVGAMGSDQVFSFSILGPVVNQSSRIEGITKAIEVPLLISREVAERVSPDVAATLRIGRFQPAGMTAALDLFELVPPPGDASRSVAFARCLLAFENGAWEDAYEALDGLPSRDRPARYLKLLAEQYRRHPPKDWRGVIELTEK